MKTPETNYQDTNGKENEKKAHGLGVSKEDSDSLKNKIGNINDLIDHDQPITTTDLSNLESALNTMKVDVGGGAMMTPEEAKNFPDLKHNAKIWKEMSEGNFDHTHLLTRITPEVSKYLVNKRGNIDLFKLTTTEGLILPQTTEGSLYLNSLTTAEGLTLPQTVKGHLWLEDLTTIEGLNLPKNIKGSLWLSSLTTIEGLNLPKTVGGNIYFKKLLPSEIEKLKEQRPDLADKIIFRTL